MGVFLATFLGLAAGYTLTRPATKKVGFVILGAIIGVAMANIIYTAFLIRWDATENHGTLIMLTLMIFMGVIFSLLGIYFTDFIECLSTSYFGSFLIFRVMGLMLGGYPDS